MSRTARPKPKKPPRRPARERPVGEGSLRAKRTGTAGASRRSRAPSARCGRSAGLPFTRESAPTSVPPPASDDELFAPSPYAGMSQAERRVLSEHILRDAFGEAPPDAKAKAKAKARACLQPAAGGASEEEEDEEEEDWPSELHPLHSHLHEG